jgi:putative two-component system response regulator
VTNIIAPIARSIVLVVDDVAANRELLEGHLVRLGYDVRQACDGLEALAMVAAEEPDLVLLDVDMPGLDGIEVCRRLKASDRTRLVPVVIVTAFQDRAVRLSGMEAGADDFVTKPIDSKELLIRCRVLLHERALNKRLDATEDVLFALARAVEARDRYTIHHAERVGMFAREIGRGLGLTVDDLELLYQGGVLHDLGKIAIPDAILLKPGPLNEDEFAIMRTHSAEGERICGSLRTTRPYLPIIRHHHERIDGRGYPDHLVGREIPIGARVAAISDSWDAMVSDRPYRAGLGAEEALHRLRLGAGTQWDPQLIEIFLALIEDGMIERVASAQSVPV